MHMIGGILSTLLSIVMISTLASAFLYHIPFLHTATTYLSVAIFSGFIVFDTQRILENAISGAQDDIGDAMVLFTNVINLFIKILQVLMANEERKRREQEQNRRRR